MSDVLDIKTAVLDADLAERLVCAVEAGDVDDLPAFPHVVRDTAQRFIDLSRNHELPCGDSCACYESGWKEAFDEAENAIKERR